MDANDANTTPRNKPAKIVSCDLEVSTGPTYRTVAM